MTPQSRRRIQATLYELIAIVCVTPFLTLAFNQPVAESLALSVLISCIALIWNYVFNGWFEKWEARQTLKARSFKRRLVHGLAFEGGLACFLVPLSAYWLNISLFNALLLEFGFLLFFFVYAIVFTWGFDAVFGLPASARDNKSTPKNA